MVLSVRALTDKRPISGTLGEFVRAHIFKDLNIIVYEDGLIRNIHLNKTIKHIKDRYGYPRVYFKAANSQRKSAFVHRLLAQAFIPNPDNKRCVNHIDGNKSNYALSNLEWCTHKENTSHAYKSGLMKKLIQSQGDRVKVTRNRAVKVLADNGFTRFEIATLFECSEPNITRIINNFKESA